MASIEGAVEPIEQPSLVRVTPRPGHNWQSRVLATAIYLVAVVGLGLVALTGPQTAAVEPITEAIAGGGSSAVPVGSATTGSADVVLD